MGHLAPDLLGRGAGRASVDSPSLVPMRRDDGAVAGIHAGDGTPLRISCSLELNIVVHHAALGFPHALDDDLLGRLPAAMRPKFRGLIYGMRTTSPIWYLAEMVLRASAQRAISLTGST